MTRRAIAIAGALFGLAACGQKEQAAPTGELILALQTDMELPKDVDKVRIRVSSFGNTVFSNDYQVGPNDLKIPATLGLLANKEHPSSPVTIQVIGFRQKTPRVMRETITTIPDSRIATLRVPIEWLCDDSARIDNNEVVTTCAAGETCVSGTCVTSTVDSATLPDYRSADIFGGGDGSGNGTCFDVARCFANPTSLVVDPATCRASLPADDPNLNVALKLPGTGDGICSNGVCLIPLDGGDGGQWLRTSAAPGQSGIQIQLPQAVCTRLGAGKVESILVSKQCQAKTARMPTCGPWSSAGSDTIKNGDGGFVAPDACPGGNCGPPSCNPPPADGGFCMGVVSTPMSSASCRWDVPGGIATNGSGFCANLLNVQLANVPNMPGPPIVLPHLVEGMCGQDMGWQFVGGTSTLELCPAACTMSMSQGVRVEFVHGCPSVGPGGNIPPPDGGTPPGSLPIVGGAFMMGCAPGDGACVADEMPYHSVSVSDFSIDETEVTQQAYDQCVRAGACVAPPCGWQPAIQANWPVSCVSWDEAAKYCMWLNKRLPTEAEWEIAARGMNAFVYPWGSAAPDCTRANYALCAFNGPQAVRSFMAGMSPYRLHDLAGNVAEWVNDWYGPYEAAPPMNPGGPAAGTQRTVRGGHFRSNEADLRTSRRQAFDPNTRVDNIGFRCAKPGFMTR